MAEEKTLIWIEKVERVGFKYKITYTNCDKPLTLTEDQLIEFRMMKGNSFYQEEWEEILNSLDFGKIFDAALHYIDYKPRTALEVKDKLKEKKVSDEVIDEVIEKLKSMSFIDDERYTKNYIEEELRNLIGPKVIIYNLSLKGIDNDLINKYLSNYHDDYFYDNAFKLAEKTLKTVVGYPLQKQKETIYNRLMRTGYSSNIINKVASNIDYSPLDMDRFDKDFNLIISKEKDKTKIISKLLQKGYSYDEVKRKISEDED